MSAINTCLRNGRFLCPCGCSVLIALATTKEPNTDGIYIVELSADSEARPKAQYERIYAPPSGSDSKA